MFNPKLICPKCGHQFSVQLGQSDSQVIHVTAPGTKIACPNCAATFSVAEALPKEASCSKSLKATFLIYGVIIAFTAVWLMLR